MTIQTQELDKILSEIFIPASKQERSIDKAEAAPCNGKCASGVCRTV